MFILQKLHKMCIQANKKINYEVVKKKKKNVKFKQN